MTRTPSVSPIDLRSATALALRAHLTAADDTDPLRRISQARAAFPEASPDLISAVMTQVTLAQRGARRLGDWADDMVLETAALEQATRRDVARYRAAELRARLANYLPDTPHPAIVDLGCGIGVDARALAETGSPVTVVDIDPWRCAAAADNARLAGTVHMWIGDIADCDTSGFAAAFVDPARRPPGDIRSVQGTRSVRASGPEDWSPPWTAVRTLAQRLPLVAKVAPGIPLSLIPDSAEVEWIDHDGDTVEACIWFAPLATARRRATVVPPDRPREAESLVETGAPPAPVAAQLGRLIIEPSPAVRHAGLLDELADYLDAQRLSPDSNWLTADAVRATGLARAWHVVHELPHAPKQLRAALTGRGSVTWKTNDVTASAGTQDARVGHRPTSGGRPATVVLTADGRVIEVEP